MYTDRETFLCIQIAPENEAPVKVLLVDTDPAVSAVGRHSTHVNRSSGKTGLHRNNHSIFLVLLLLDFQFVSSRCLSCIINNVKQACRIGK